MKDAPAHLALTEEGMKAALLEARGDLFVAAQILGVTALRLDRAIRLSPALQAAMVTLSESKETDAFAKLSSEQIAKAIDQRTTMYRIVGLDALHDLAAMPIDDNSAQNQVKLAAAARLAGSQDGLGAGGDLAMALREMNDAYHLNAPRIRIARQTVVEITPGQPHVVAEIPAPDPLPE